VWQSKGPGVSITCEPEVLTILIVCPAGTKVATPCLAGTVCISGILLDVQIGLGKVIKCISRFACEFKKELLKNTTVQILDDIDEYQDKG
jgi:hypothetical protein